MHVQVASCALQIGKRINHLATRTLIINSVLLPVQHTLVRNNNSKVEAAHFTHPKQIIIITESSILINAHFLTSTSIFDIIGFSQ